jgi:NAD(P)-dependent dehydrogenase (short-subunit alcohol dehydrogenase family)
LAKLEGAYTATTEIRIFCWDILPEGKVPDTKFDCLPRFSFSFRLMDIKGAHAIVTGGASGIGRSLALALVREGATVTVTDINQDKLDAVLNELNAVRGGNTGERVDHTNEKENEGFLKSYSDKNGAPGILCLNVGVGLGSPIEKMTFDDWRWIIDRNLWANIYMAQLFIPEMIKAHGSAKPGHVLITSSVAGLVPAPAMSAYCLTKYALTGFAESLRLELHKHSIGVSALCPGIVNTNIINAGRMKTHAQGGSAVSPETAYPTTDRTSSALSADDAAKKSIADFYAKRGISPDRIAKDAMKAIKKNIAIMPSAEDAQAMYFAKKIAPATLDFAVSRLWKWGFMKGISG